MPVVLKGEGHYVLTSVKEIQVTAGLVALGEKVTGCQTEESRWDCVTRSYQEQLLASCHCAPLHIRKYLPGQVIGDMIPHHLDVLS